MRYFDIKWSFKGSLLSLLDRQQPCYLCGALSGTTHGLCLECEAELPRPVHVDNHPAFSQTVAALEYRYPVDVLVRDLKYRGQIQLAALLARQLHQAVLKPPSPQHSALAQKEFNVADPHSEPWRIAFVPQGRSRLKERGFNQAEEIARQVSAKTGIPMLQAGLKRVRETPHQAGLGRALRQENLNQAFACNGNIQGLRIALVDDVMTTGATLNAVASCLRQAGASSVSAWVVARTPAPDFAPMR